MLPPEKTPTLGLLAGTISAYCAQFVFGGAVAGQLVFDSTETFGIEAPSAGTVTRRGAPPLGVTLCNADTAASIVAPELPVVAVTNPCSVAGACGSPVSAKSLMLPR